MKTVVAGASVAVPAGSAAFEVILTQDCTITLPRPPREGVMVLLIRQGVTAHAVTWSGPVMWLAGAAPVLPAAGPALVTFTAADTVWLGRAPRVTPVSAGFAPADPSDTASTSLVCMGLGATCAITPAASGKVLVTVTGFAQSLTAAANITVGCRYGTGAAPANGDADTGTRFGAHADPVVKPGTTGVSVPFAFTGLLSLTPGTSYWLDVVAATGTGADHAKITDVGVTAVEL
jgi:hypothetical protein